LVVLVARGLEDLGVELLLSTRLDLASLSEHGKVTEDGRHIRTVRTTSGQSLSADIVLLCTGQTPNTTLLKEFAPETIDDSTGYAKVNRALQLLPHQLPASTSSGDDSLDGAESLLDDLDLDGPGDPEMTSYGHIFIIGDAADAFGAIKAGHNAYFQAEVASKNILGLISRETSQERDVELQDYTPKPPMIKLSLGLVSFSFPR
jgi:pyruvate/2-oxoglutarate dehydrogenase complex dihydrolipoamide dehydrogenase (E3) component